jgi:hypothetical protein
MIPALTIAVAGLVDASQRLNAAAASTVQKGALPAADQARGLASYLEAGQPKALRGAGGGSTAAGPNAGGSGRSATKSLAQFDGGAAIGTPLYIPSFAEDALTLRTAAAAYKANALVIRTLDEISESLSDTLANSTARTKDSL